MYSHQVSFYEIIEGVKDDTGISDLRSRYSQIRRLIYRCEQDIGFSNTLVMRKITYSKEKGNIVNKKVRLPDDILKIESVGMCKEGLCPGDYRIQGNFMFLCRDIDEFSFIYYTLYKDEEGNPVTTQNHKEAVISGIAYYMYKPLRFQNKGSQNVYESLKRYYEDRVGEARGDDFMPTTQEQWSYISRILRMSSSQVLIYDKGKSCYTCVDEYIPDNSDKPIEDILLVYQWQYDDFTSDISLAPTIDQAYLDLQTKVPEKSFKNGMNFTYTKIGRIGFALQNTANNKWNILDVIGNIITDTVFDRYYNSTLKTEIFISKEVYSFGDIYFKLVKR